VKISIDSNEALEDVLRVVGAAYDVTLTVHSADAATEGTPPSAPSEVRSSRRSKSRKAAPRSSNSRGRSTEGRASVSNAQLRSWARENGHTISDRGRVPLAVVTAYREAN
jgi:hypothetical protein